MVNSIKKMIVKIILRLSRFFILSPNGKFDPKKHILEGIKHNYSHQTNIYSII